MTLRQHRFTTFGAFLALAVFCVWLVAVAGECGP